MRGEERSRASAAWLLLACTALLAVAAWLEPSPTGVGTHEALGLSPCPMRTWLALPCPGCGLTTGLSHCVRGAWLAAFHAHPLAPPLFLALAGGAILGAWGLLDPARVGGLPKWRTVGLRWLALLALALWYVRVWPLR